MTFAQFRHQRGIEIERRALPKLLSQYIFVNSDGEVTALPTTARATVSPLVPNASGTYVQYAANNVAIAGGDSVACWPATTNLFTYSEEFDDASWGKTWLSVGANEANAPDGNATMDALDASNLSSVDHYINKSISISLATNTWYVLSVFAMANAVDFVYLSTFDNASNGVRQFFDLSTGSLGSSDDFNVPLDRAAGIEDVGNGVYRCWIAQLVGSTRTTVSARAGPADSDLGRVYSASDLTTAQIYSWGAQLQTGSFPTYYVPTTGAAASVDASEPVVAWPSGLVNDFVVKFDWTPVGGTNSARLDRERLFKILVDANNYFECYFENAGGNLLVIANARSGTSLIRYLVLNIVPDTTYSVSLIKTTNRMEIFADDSPSTAGNGGADGRDVSYDGEATIGHHTVASHDSFAKFKNIRIIEVAPNISDAEVLAL